MAKCKECDYLQKERAGFWIEAGAPESQATFEGRKERCHDHRQPDLNLGFDARGRLPHCP